MQDFLGVTENFAVAENTPWSSSFAFFEGDNPTSLDNLTFAGAVLIGGQSIIIGFEKTGENSVQVFMPGVPAGRWPYEIYAVADNGTQSRMISGYIGSVEAMDRHLPNNAYQGRTLSVRLPQGSGGRIRLEWLAGSYAVTAADNAERSAKAAEASAVQAETSATQAAESAADARNTLDNINTIIQQSIEDATRRAETAAANAAQSVLQAAATLEECQSIRNQTHDLLGQALYVLTQCRTVYNEILALIETGAVGEAITAATGNILEQILTDPALTARFVAAMKTSGAFVCYDKLGRALTATNGTVDVDLSNYSGTVVSINGTTSASVKSGTTASLTLSAGSAALYGGTSVSVVQANDNKLTLYTDSYGVRISEHQAGDIYLYAARTALMQAVNGGANQITINSSLMRFKHSVKIEANKVITNY